MLLFKVEFYAAVWYACMVSCCGIGEHAKLTLKLKCFVKHTEQIELCSAVLHRTMQGAKRQERKCVGQSLLGGI
jgi:hypothetical protein